MSDLRSLIEEIRRLYENRYDDENGRIKRVGNVGRNEMARQWKLLLVEIVDRFKKEQLAIDRERQLSRRVIDENTRGALKRSNQMTPE